MPHLLVVAESFINAMLQMLLAPRILHGIIVCNISPTWRCWFADQHGDICLIDHHDVVVCLIMMLLLL